MSAGLRRNLMGRVGGPGWRTRYAFCCTLLGVFGWTYVDASGEEVGTSRRFPDAESAEDWMGDAWRDLLENGIEEVVLFDHERGRRLYRMGLGSD